MKTLFSPGKFLCVDEIMSSLKGLSSHFDALGILHQSKIARKPEGEDAEMKAMACGECGYSVRKRNYGE